MSFWSEIASLSLMPGESFFTLDTLRTQRSRFSLRSRSTRSAHSTLESGAENGFLKTHVTFHSQPTRSRIAHQRRISRSRYAQSPSRIRSSAVQKRYSNSFGGLYCKSCTILCVRYVCLSEAFVFGAIQIAVLVIKFPMNCFCALRPWTSLPLIDISCSQITSFAILDALTVRKLREHIDFVEIRGWNHFRAEIFENSSNSHIRLESFCENLNLSISNIEIYQ